MGQPRSFNTFVSAIMAIFFCVILINSVGAANLASTETPEIFYQQIEVISDFFSIQNLTTGDGTQLSAYIINGPSQPLPEYQAEREASLLANSPQALLPNFPSYNWVFGCSAVSAAMIAAWHDRGEFSNIYTGPTNTGVMPLTDTAWSAWSDGKQNYPSNPLVASRKGLDGYEARGSIDDYWGASGSSSQDPYLTGGWSEHTWGSSIGDYMKTSQSECKNSDGSTTFWNYSSSSDKLHCSAMLASGVADQDGTYGRKLFYQARGYLVGDCYNQKTDNNSGGFTLGNLKAEIDAGYPVLLNLEGHSVVAYGYTGSTIYIRDTWDSNPNNVYTMQWGGSYNGMKMLSVSIVHLAIFTGDQHLYLPLIKN